MKKVNIIALLVLMLLSASVKAQLTKPEDFFKFKPGTDRMLFDYEQLIDYLKLLEKESPRVKMLQIGETMMHKPMYVVFLSSEKNINNLNLLKEINKELAINGNLTEEQVDAYAKEGKVFVLATLSMHSDEVGPAQAAPLEVYRIASSKEDELVNKEFGKCGLYACS